MIKYLIIDDEHIAHDIIKTYCDMLPNLQWAKSCYDAIEAMTYLNEKSVDLIFLDLNMPKLKGFEFLKILEVPPKIIVTTAYAEFALEGYELNITDYLLKPFSFERFVKAINKAMMNAKPKDGLVSSALSEVDNTIFLRSNKKYVQVRIDDIQFIEASGNYTLVVTAKEKISVREKISSVLLALDNKAFIQVHKSFAVAVKHIKSIEGNRIAINDHIVPIGKLFKSQINELLR